MKTRARLPLLLIATTLAAAPPATRPAATAPAEAAHYVDDRAGVFGRPAVADAEAALADVERRYQKQLIVETVAAVPAADRAAVARDKAAYFRDQLDRRARSTKANGVYVLICMDPKWVEVAAGEHTRARGLFTADDLAAVRKGLVADLRAGRYDAALAGAVDRVARTYAEHAAGR